MRLYKSKAGGDVREEEEEKEKDGGYDKR